MTIGWAIALSWTMRRWLRQKMAWQWWQQQQVLQSHHTAESIRDGLLQQTFALRRYLEMAESQPLATFSAEPRAAQTASWLTQFQALYQSLENLSNELSSPFVADSLPLALQFALENWQRSHPSPPLQLTLPSAHPTQASFSQNQAVLSVTLELLKQLPTQSAKQIQITLNSESQQNNESQQDPKSPHHTLKLELVGPAQTIRKAVAQLEIRHLKEIFHSLMTGQLEIDQEGDKLICQMDWRD